jgi:hypothetical protein
MSCDQLFDAFPDKELSTTDYVADFVNRQHYIHHYARQHLKVANGGMEAPNEYLANSMGLQE